MSREGSLIKNTAIITIGKICTQLISFFLLPIYTALLTTTEYGIVDLLNTLVSLLLPVITLQIEQALFRYLIDAREDENAMKTIISTTFFSLIIQSIIYILLFIIVSKWINNEYKYFLATNLIASIFSSIMLQISRGLGDNKNYAIGSFITAITTIILNIIFIIIFKFGAYGMLLASLLANMICSIYIFMVKKVYQYINLAQFKMVVLKKLWKYSIPLIPNALSWWVFNSSDRIIVSSILGLGANGILAAAHKFSTVYITIYNIFNMTWTESVSMHIDDKDNSEFVSKVINKVIAIFSCLCFGIIAFMPFVFPIMINDTYIEAYNQIPILMIGALFNVGVGMISAIYIAKKKTKEVAKTSIISAIINIIVNLLLIKFVGLYAASISTLIAYMSMLIYRYIDVKKYINLIVDRKLIFETFIMTLILFVGYYINNFVLNCILLVITIIYSIIINKSNIKFILSIFEKIKKGKKEKENEK